MKAYLLIFDSSQATRSQISQTIDRMAPVANWYAFFENTLCLASEENARSLSALLRKEYPALRFLITEVEPQSKAGWLPVPIWEFLNNPVPAPAPSKANA